jgi:hypothetical protein
MLAATRAADDRAPRSAHPAGDMRVAACCLTRDISRTTLNLKHYEDFR